MKRLCLVVVIILMLILSGCAEKKEIKIGLTVNGNTLENIVKQVPVNMDVYVEYTQDKSFDADSVELEIASGDRTVSGGNNYVNKEDKTVIIPITIPKSGIYQLKILINGNVVYQTDVVAH